MAKKLVPDRTIDLRLGGGGRITVPNDEIWEVSVFNLGSVNNSWSLNTKILPSSIFGGGSAIKVDGASPGAISGIAFKVQEV